MLCTYYHIVVSGGSKCGSSFSILVRKGKSLIFFFCLLTYSWIFLESWLLRHLLLDLAFALQEVHEEDSTRPPDDSAN